jgi:glycosyltransferase involved in cell wall biosynthesis
MKRLLMISYPFPPNASAGAVRSERFARYLPQFGWAVDVVTIKPRKDMFGDTGQLGKLGSNVKVHFTRSLDPWLWLKGKNPRNLAIRGIRSLLMRLFSFPDHMLLWVRFAVREGLEICKREEVDVIYSTSPPHSTHIAAQIVSMMTHKPWVADFRDPWTLNAYRRQGVLERSLFGIEKGLERSVLKKASVILANTEANRRNLLKAFPLLSEAKVARLPNGWEEFPAEFYQMGKKDGSLTIVHAGSFYPRFKPYGLLYALAAWRDGKAPSGIPRLGNGDIKIVLLGATDDETAKVVLGLKISEFVEFRPWVAIDEARRIMCQADLLWASLGTGKESSTYIPSKLFEYIAAGRPIIGFFPEGEGERIIRKTGTGVVFSTDDQQEVIRALAKLVMSREKSRSPEWYLPNPEVINSYRIENIVRSLANVLDRA